MHQKTGVDLLVLKSSEYESVVLGITSVCLIFNIPETRGPTLIKLGLWANLDHIFGITQNLSVAVLKKKSVYIDLSNYAQE